MPGVRLDLSIHTIKSGVLVSSMAASFKGTQGNIREDLIIREATRSLVTGASGL